MSTSLLTHLFVHSKHGRGKDCDCCCAELLQPEQDRQMNQLQSALLKDLAAFQLKMMVSFDRVVTRWWQVVESGSRW